MADIDFLSYSSIYGEFSKGPKSIYYGVGDEMLPGAILNVPQQDEDDEWGRTQRIADERLYDFIAKIYKTLFDPYNTIPDISLVPGEAGSEINVAKSMIKLIGRSGIDTGIFDLLNTRMTLGSVVVDGGVDTLKIEDTILSSNSLSINGVFNFQQTGTRGTIDYGNVKTTWFDDTTAPKFDINVNSKVFSFGLVAGVPTLTIPAGGELNVPGIRTTNIYAIYGEFESIRSGSVGTSILGPQTPTDELVIGPAARVLFNTSEIQTSGVGFARIVATSALYLGSTNGIATLTGSTIDLGLINSFSGAIETNATRILSKDLKFYDINSVSPYFNSYEVTGMRILNIGSINNQHTINMVASRVSQGTICGGFNIFTQTDPNRAAFSVSDFYIFHNKDVYPGTPNTYKLGSDSLMYNRVYSTFVNTDNIRPLGTLLQISAPDIFITNPVSGSVHIAFGNTGIQLSNNIFMSDPNKGIFNIGSSTSWLGGIYTRDVYTDYVRTTKPNLFISAPWISIQHSITGDPIAGFGNSGGTDAVFELDCSTVVDRTDVHNIGSSGGRFLGIYTKNMYLEDLYSTKPSGWNISGAFLRFRNTTVGRDIMGIGDKIWAYADIEPDVTESYDIGKSYNRFKSVHTQNLYTENISDYGTSGISISGNYIGLNSNANIDFIVGGSGKFGIGLDSTTTYVNMYVLNILPRVNATYTIGRDDERFSQVYSTDFFGSYLGSDTRFFDRLYVKNIYPEPNNCFVGSSDRGFQGMYIKEQGTGIPKRIFVACGVVYAEP